MLLVMISSESIPIPKQNLLSFKVMQFESKIITGNGRQLTSRESTYLWDLSTFAKTCATQMKVQIPGLL